MEVRDRFEGELLDGLYSGVVIVVRHSSIRTRNGVTVEIEDSRE
jgi:hypothetical protein